MALGRWQIVRERAGFAGLEEGVDVDLERLDADVRKSGRDGLFEVAERPGRTPDIEPE